MPRIKHKKLLSQKQLQILIERQLTLANKNENESEKKFSLILFNLYGLDRDLFSALIRTLENCIHLPNQLGWYSRRCLGLLLPSTDELNARKFADNLQLNPDLTLPSFSYKIFSFPSLDVDKTVKSPDIWVRPLHAWKRFIDVTSSIAGFILLSPLFLFCVIAIKLSSGGPVFFTQIRAGLGARPFKIYKFRTMIEGAEKLKKELMDLNEQVGPVFKIKNDPRVTKVGRFLRKISLDELPQLWNVLKGDMSLVGPRPATFDEVKLYNAWQRIRLEVTPGITCIWQVSGRSTISFHEWVNMDICYVMNRSLILDLKILLLTVYAVFSGKGAQ